jgi:hypothetical protein
MGDFTEDYCKCLEPDVDGSQEDGYFCTVCNKEMTPVDPPDEDEENESSFGQQNEFFD